MLLGLVDERNGGDDRHGDDGWEFFLALFAYASRWDIQTRGNVYNRRYDRDWPLDFGNLGLTQERRRRRRRKVEVVAVG